MYVVPIACGIFGLIIGSFLNVLILRHGTRPLTGRSACMSCDHTLSFFDLIPVFSWIFLAGKCRYCASRISIQYPLVEFFTAALFATVGGAIDLTALLSVPALGFMTLFLKFAIMAVLVAIAVYDMRHTIIPDAWSFLFALFAFVLSALTAKESLLELIVSGPLVASPLFLLWLVSRGTWMGLGDPKLALGIGWLLGIYAGFTAVMCAFIIGAIVALCILIPLDRLRAHAEHITMKSEVPFGPFLIASTLLFWIAEMYGFPLDLFTWL